MPKLTLRTVAAAQPQGRDYFLWDDDLPGFGLRIFGSGKRSYLIQYKAAGRTRRITIGPHGPITPNQARTRALALLSEVKSGGDPAEDRAGDRKAATVAQLAERYMAEWAGLHKRPRSAEEDARNLRLHVLPAFGLRKVRDITKHDVEKLHAALSVERDGDSPERSTPARANRVRALLSKMFALAEDWNIRPVGSNPCRGVKPFRELKRERYLSSTEVARLWSTLTELERNLITPAPVVSLVRLLLLTGARLSEILTLHWDQVDFERACLMLSDSKTGAKVIHLNTPALGVLAGIERLEDNPYVIAGKKPGAHFVGVQRAWQRIRTEAGLPDLRLHDLRHTYASILAGLGEGLPIIGKVLGHSQPATTARYAHIAADPVKHATERAGAALVGMVNGEAAEVVEMPSRKR